ncbi:MAG TPA: nucleotide exchange factor GrpE, partial [Planctomycetes bacterium]|nr:nucleotide exchange factor GrpE [Planctomycetota bacterium]
MTEIPINHKKDKEAPKPDTAAEQPAANGSDTADAAPPDNSGVTAPDAAAREDLEKLREKAEMLEKALQYERADFINYRQRAAKEMERIAESVKRQLVMDAAELVEAFHHTDAGLARHKDFDSLREAYEILRSEFDRLLEKWQAAIIGAPGEPFDAARHEAVMRMEDEKAEAPTVKEVVKPGLALSDFVIRAARVVVAVPPPKRPAEAPEDK